jgi:hypothetical protein
LGQSDTKGKQICIKVSKSSFVYKTTKKHLNEAAVTLVFSGLYTDKGYSIGVQNRNIEALKLQPM